MKTSILLSIYVVAAAALVSAADPFPLFQTVQHTVKIDQWDLPPEPGHAPFRVEFDGRPLGENAQALSDLDDIKFESNSLVKVVLPSAPMPGDNFLCRTSFLLHALDDGANLEFYQGEKRVNCHLLSFQNIRPGKRKRWDTDTATYTLDGKKFYDGPSAAMALKNMFPNTAANSTEIPPKNGSKRAKQFWFYFRGHSNREITTLRWCTNRPSTVVSNC